MTIKLTRPLVRAALDRAVARKGKDYRYLSEYELCEYVEPDTLKPRCIVGMVLIDLGVPAQDFLADVSQHGMRPGSLNANRFPGIAQYLDLKVDERVVSALGKAQDIQDDGGTWGMARDAAVAILDGTPHPERDLSF